LPCNKLSKLTGYDDDCVLKAASSENCFQSSWNKEKLSNRTFLLNLLRLLAYYIPKQQQHNQQSSAKPNQSYIMGHVKQKKSTSSSTSTPPDPTTGLAISDGKEHYASALATPSSSRPTYPEELNAEELISQINCRTASSSNHHHNNNNNNEITNDSNNNSNSNNNTINRNSNQHRQRRTSANVVIVEGGGEDDVEKGSAATTPVRRHHRHQRPLYRRLFNFIRNLWMGAKFNVGKDGKKKLSYNYCCMFLLWPIARD